MTMRRGTLNRRGTLSAAEMGLPPGLPGLTPPPGLTGRGDADGDNRDEEDGTEGSMEDQLAKQVRLTLEEASQKSKFGGSSRRVTMAAGVHETRKSQRNLCERKSLRGSMASEDAGSRRCSTRLVGLA